MSTMEATREVPTLTLADRCDKCIGQATTIVPFKTGFLYFCDHHTRVLEPSYAPYVVAFDGDKEPEKTSV